MASNDTLCMFNALANMPPAANFATLDVRNTIPVLEFDKAAAAEYAVFIGVLPRHYAGGGITVQLTWMGDTGLTSGDVVWQTAFERMNADEDADAFVSAKTATGTANGTSGIVTNTDIAHSNAEIGGLLVGEPFRLQIARLGSNGSDTMDGDAQLVAVELRET